MISKYTVVHYLPRPLSGERMNVGVIAWGEGQIAARFIQDWRRVRAFGHEDIEFIQDFAQRVERAATKTRELPGFANDTLDEAGLQEIVGTWTHSIQFSELGSSLKSPSEVVREVSPIFLPELPRSGRRARDRRSAAAIATRKVLEVLVDRKGLEARELVKKQHDIRGKFDEHTFDVVVTNGQPFLAAQGLSFEVTDLASLRKDVDATAWAIDDVKKEHGRLPLAVFALPPRKESELFKRAKKVFGGLRAEVVVSDEQMGHWVKRVVTKLPGTAGGILR